MAVKLSVVRRNDKRRMALESLAELVGLLDPLADKVRGVLGRLFAGERRDVRLLLILRNVAAGDAVIFEAEMAAAAVRVQVRF